MSDGPTGAKTGSPPFGVLAPAAATALLLTTKQHRNGCVRRLVAGGCAARGPRVGRLSPNCRGGVVRGCEASGREGGPIGDIWLRGPAKHPHKFLA